MDKKQYILLAILFGWISFFVFPIEKPALTYFLGVLIGVMSLFYIPYEKYTHNVMFQGLLWSVLLLLIPEYIIAGLAVGVFAHMVIDYSKKCFDKLNLSFYQKRLVTTGLLTTNFVIVTSIMINKFINF